MPRVVADRRRDGGPNRLGAALFRLTRRVVPVTVSRTKMSDAALVSPATRLVAVLANAKYRPSLLSEGQVETPPVAWAPAVLRLSRVVVAAPTEYKNTSAPPLVSASTRSRLVASLT